MSIFSETLRKLRERRGMDRQTLAKMLNVSETHIIRLETAYLRPDEKMLAKLAECFDVDVYYLCGNISLNEDTRERVAGKYLSVPVLSTSSAINTVVRESEIIDRVILPFDSSSKKDYIGIVADRDGSCTERVRKGDVVLVELTNSFCKDDIAAVSINGAPAEFKRYTRRGPDIILEDFEGGKAYEYSVGDKSCRILGKVIGFQGKI